MWTIAHASIVLLSVIAGYRDISGHDLLDPEDMPVVLYLGSAVVFALLPVLSVTAAVKKDSVQELRSPSLNRNPFNWRKDRLQFVLVTGLAAIGTVIGSAVATIAYWPQGRWTLGLYCSILAGLVIGYLLTRKIYRKLIV